MVHGDDFTQTYSFEAALAFETLLFRLSLRRIPGGERLRPDDRQDLYLAVARGLADGIIRYLWRNRVDAEVGLVTPHGRSAFGDPAAQRSYLVARVRDVPDRILDLFVSTPGIEVFQRLVRANGIAIIGQTSMVR